MFTRRLLLTLLVLAAATQTFANPLSAPKTAYRLWETLRGIKKVGGTLTMSAVAGVVSAKVLKDFEHAHDDAPAMHVIAYYALVGNRKVNDAATFWVHPDERQLDFLRTFERLELRDLKELSRTPERAAVWVVLHGNQVTKAPRSWQGTVYLQWTESAWMITHSRISQGSAA